MASTAPVTSVTITAADIGRLGACGGGTAAFRKLYPQGLVLDQASLNKYYNAPYKPINQKFGYSPSWVFTRINMNYRASHDTYNTSPSHIYDYSRDADITAARKAVTSLRAEMQKEIREAEKRIEKKYAARIAKKRAVGMKIAKRLSAAKRKKKPVKAPTLATFATKLAAATQRRAYYY